MLRSTRLTIGVLTLLALSQSTVLFPVEAQTPAKIPVTTTVTVLGPKFTDPPAIAKQDITAFSGGTPLDVIDWVPAQGQNGELQLAIVIDNSLNRFGGGPELDEVNRFVRVELQTQGTEISVFYAVNGGVQLAAPLGRDPDSIVKALRSPVGPIVGGSSNEYQSLIDLMNHHMQSTNGRREILLISNGVNLSDGRSLNIEHDTAIESARRAGIEIHAICIGGVSPTGAQFAQGGFAKITEDSGGYNLFQGTYTPESLLPYLRQMDTILHHQYRLTFAIESRTKGKGELHAIKIHTIQHDVELRYPNLVWIPKNAK